MKKIFNFFASLRFIFMPHYWVMLGKYDKQWDEQLNELALKHDFVPVNAFNDKDTAGWASLGDVHMWIGSYPFSFFVKEDIREVVSLKDGFKAYFYHQRNSSHQPRPSRLTIHRLRNKLVADFKKHNKTVDLTIS